MAKVLKLNNGMTMPSVGLGTISFNESDEKIKFAIVTAIRVLTFSQT
jgi:diketogulonate reductase-like aldo/keto reductase